MNNTLPIIAGVDYPIQKIQGNLYQFAKDTWGVTDENFDSWGRTSRNWKDDGFIPQPLKECSTKDLFYNDKLAGLSFFQVIDPVKVDGTQTIYNVALYLLVNLDRIKPDSVAIQRMDMEVVDELCQYLDGQYGFAISDVHWDIDKILSEYSGEKKRNGVISWNMHPKFCVRIDGTISGVQVGINRCDSGVIDNNNPTPAPTPDPTPGTVFATPDFWHNSTSYHAYASLVKINAPGTPLGYGIWLCLVTNSDFGFNQAKWRHILVWEPGAGALLGYSPGDVVYHESRVYNCLAPNSDVTFNIDHWQAI